MGTLDYISQSGYVIKATEENFKKLNLSFDGLEKTFKEVQKEYPNENFEFCLEQLCCEEDSELTSTIDEKTFTIILFYYDSAHGNSCDDLEDGVYFFIQEHDLFERKETKFYKNLSKKGVVPTFCTWTEQR